MEIDTGVVQLILVAPMQDRRERRAKRVVQALEEIRDDLQALPEDEGPLDLHPLRGKLPPVPDSADSEVDEELALIAQRVRRWREDNHLTLQELARRSGVAASTIQKIETQQMIPTIAVLLKIARGLDRAPSDLIRSDSDEHQIVHTRAEERHPVGLLERMQVERLVGDLFEPHLEVWRISHDPGSGSGRTRIRFEGETLILCEAGEITFYVGEQTIRLRAGDSLHFKSILAHGWRNNGDETARFLNIATLPRVIRARLHQSLRDANLDEVPEPA
jgi:transcriptional regulator with XRE-family HTH domain